jgi:hypothetical protein
VRESLPKKAFSTHSAIYFTIYLPTIYCVPEQFFVVVVLFFVLVGLGFELRASHLQSRFSYFLNHTFSPFCSGYFLEMGGGSGLKNYLPRLALNCDPPNLSLPSS